MGDKLRVNCDHAFLVLIETALILCFGNIIMKCYYDYYCFIYDFYSSIVSLAWGLHREMRRRLIIHETASKMLLNSCNLAVHAAILKRFCGAGQCCKFRTGRFTCKSFFTPYFSIFNFCLFLN